MDATIAAVLAEYENRADREAALMRSLPVEEGMRRRDEFLIPVGRAAGLLLNRLVKAVGATRVVEFGTSYGYSTLWLAEAARETGGRVTTLEIHPGKIAHAAAMLERAGLAGVVEFLPGDARDTLRAVEGAVDFVLIDLWKDLYIPCFDRLVPKLADGAVVVADNMTHPPFHREDADAYRRHVRAMGCFDSLLLPVGSGLELSRFRAASAV